MRLAQEFRQFLLKQNALALAVAVVVGNAINRVVQGIVEDVLMPVIGLILPEGNWREARLTLAGENSIRYGDLLGRVVDFVIIAGVVFALTRLLLERVAPPATSPPDVRPCPRCLEQVPRAATRCRACTSDLPAAA